MNKLLAKLFKEQKPSQWPKLSEEKPILNKIYAVWSNNTCWAEWNGDNFVDRYGIVQNVTHWMR